MRIDTFEMERTQCLYEHLVDYNLSESGVLPVKVRELIQNHLPEEEFLSTSLGYPWAGGSPELRELIADFYGAGAENVRVTNGSSEANFMQFWGLLEKGDRAAVMLPNYLQTWGLARHFVGRADTFQLMEDEGRWALDVESLERAVSRKTKIILITNPNNPTGAVLNEQEMNEVVRVARKAGAWIVADEIYRGAEVGNELAPTFYGRYSRVLITGGLSKAFGLPGLRIGWIIGPSKVVAKLESYHDYLTLTPTMLSEKLARVAMEPARRDQLLGRTRQIIQTQLPILAEWVQRQSDLLRFIPPRGGAIALVRYRAPIKSIRLMDRLRLEKSVLISPAAHFGLDDRYIRIGYGYDVAKLRTGLLRISELFAELSNRRVDHSLQNRKRQRAVGQ